MESTVRKGPPILLIAALALPLAAAAAPGDKASARELSVRLDLESTAALDNLIAQRLKPLALAQPVVMVAPPTTDAAKQSGKSVFVRILQNYSSGRIKADAATRAAAKRVMSPGGK